MGCEAPELEEALVECTASVCSIIKSTKRHCDDLIRDIRRGYRYLGTYHCVRECTSTSKRANK